MSPRTPPTLPRRGRGTEQAGPPCGSAPLGAQGACELSVTLPLPTSTPPQQPPGTALGPFPALPAHLLPASPVSPAPLPGAGSQAPQQAACSAPGTASCELNSPATVCRVHWELWGAGAFLLSLSLFQKVAHVFSFFLKLINTPSSHPHFSSPSASRLWFRSQSMCPQWYLPTCHWVTTAPLPSAHLIPMMTLQPFLSRPAFHKEKNELREVGDVPNVVQLNHGAHMATPTSGTLSDVNAGTTSMQVEQEVKGKGGAWETGLRFTPGTVYDPTASTKRCGPSQWTTEAKAQKICSRITIYTRFKNRQIKCCPLGTHW